MTHPFKLQVEGWRGISHSYALVNQFQLLEWAKSPHIQLSHLDKPFFFDNWGKTRNPAGLFEQDQALIDKLAPSDEFDGVFRIYSPFNLDPVPGKRVGVFMVTEFGLDVTTTPLQNIPQFVGEGGFIATPSRWSFERLVANGIPEAAIQIVPHSVDSRYFAPASAPTIQQQRQALGFQPHEVLLLNVGTQHWAKGMDLLLRASAMARKVRKDLRLVLKDQRNTYSTNTEEFVVQTLKEHDLLSDEVIQAITMIPVNLSLSELNALYNMADAYVSPYRAEGYNLPVREALACLTPVIATRGGATDDFLAGPLVTQIGGVRHENHPLKQEIPVNAFIEPDLAELTARLLLSQRKPIPPESALSVQSDWSVATAAINQRLGLPA